MALYNLEAVAPVAQKGAIKCYILGSSKQRERVGGVESEILPGGIFLPGEGNLRRSDFDNSNLFQS